MSNLSLPRSAKFPMELEVSYARDLNPASPTFYSVGGAQATENTPYYWQVSLLVATPEQGEFLEANGIPVKTVGANAKRNAGKKYISLKRNVKRRDGSDNGQVICTDPNGNPVTNFDNIGEGSMATFEVYQLANNMQPGRVVSSLTSLQFTKLNENAEAEAVVLEMPSSKPVEKSTQAVEAPF